ncbi:acyltransferase family protein [Parasphingorhabdus sp. DH2-15]|uniref:acyltransferase family protein n=1 Tax=Parasphingorhabdus sp. DH2-15 TaxID=3444112 RepID=UPI003F687785
MSSLAYRSEIDGLRAFAVVPVILFHAGLESFSGGYLGVDVFFVISGFLITSILVREMEAGQFSLAKFYERRARRILPALFAVIAVTSIFAWLWMIPPQWEDYTEGIVAMGLFATNVLFWRKTGYFDTDAEYNPLLHTWTLSVEEQFYIGFPLLLMLLFRFGKPLVLPAIIILAAVSLIISEWLSFASPQANFYLLPSRAWELMAGSLCAMILKAPDHAALRLRDNVKEILALAGLGLLIASIFIFTPETRSPSLITLVPILAVMMIILYAQSGTMAARLLSWKPFVAIGLISYSAYLWHQPLLAFHRIIAFEQKPLFTALLVAATFILAALTYFLVEQPARFKFMKQRSTKAFLLLSAGSLILCVAAGLGLRYSSHQYLPSVSAVGFQPFAGDGYAWSFVKRDNVNTAEQQDALLLYGDSYAKHLVANLDDALAENDRVFEFSGEYACIALPGVRSLYRDGVRPICQSHLDRFRTKLAARPQTLVIAQFWGARIIGDDGKAIGIDGAQNDPLALDAILAGLDILIKDLGNDQDIILVGAIPDLASAGPAMAEGIFRCKQYRDVNCPESFPKTASAYFAFNQKFAKWSAQYSNLRFVNPFDALCDEMLCYAVKNGEALYFDKGHLTRAGAQKIVDDIIKKERELKDI